MHLTTCRPKETSRNDGNGQGEVPGQRWWEESKRWVCGTAGNRRKRRQHEDLREASLPFMTGGFLASEVRARQKPLKKQGVRRLHNQPYRAIKARGQ